MTTRGLIERLRIAACRALSLEDQQGIEQAIREIERLETENARLASKCNRMLPSAKLEDIQEVTK